MELGAYFKKVFTFWEETDFGFKRATNLENVLIILNG